MISPLPTSPPLPQVSSQPLPHSSYQGPQNQVFRGLTAQLTACPQLIPPSWLLSLPLNSPASCRRQFWVCWYHSTLNAASPSSSWELIPAPLLTKGFKIKPSTYMCSGESGWINTHLSIFPRNDAEICSTCLFRGSPIGLSPQFPKWNPLINTHLICTSFFLFLFQHFFICASWDHFSSKIPVPTSFFPGVLNLSGNYCADLQGLWPI